MKRLDRPVASTIRRFVDRFPSLLMAMYRFRYRNSGFRRRILGPGTAVLIEGFPRSGNSFANRAFQFANPDLAESIATHMHLSAHVVEAARTQTPSIVPIRHPAECVPSLYALRRSVAPSERDPKNLDTWLRDYIAFAERVSRVSGDVVVVPFELITNDYGLVIDWINHKFRTDFNRFDHSDKAVSDVFSTSGSHLSPSEERKLDKARGKVLYQRSDRKLRKQAERSHAALLATVPKELWGDDVKS